MSSLWVVPYIDQPLSFWQELTERFGPAIKEVYFPLSSDLIASGRGEQPHQFMTTFLRDTSLPKAVLLNPIVLSHSAEETASWVLPVLQRLRDEFGVSRVTVANLMLARLIREKLLEFKIAASVLMGIAKPAQLLMIQDYVDALTPDNTLLRDLAGLQRLRHAFSGELRLIVNEACLPGCPFRTQHFFEMAYSKDSRPQSLCQSILQKYPWLRLTGAWILPQHLHYYDGLYDTLKLAGRVTLQDKDRYFMVLDAYVNRKPLLPRDIGGGPASILTPLSVTDELFEFLLHCDKDCQNCSVCRNFYDRNQMC